MPAVLRQVCLRYDWTGIDKKNQMNNNNNNNNGACQHTDFFACSASFAKFLLNDHASWCSSVQVFSWKISQGHFMTKYSQTRNHQLFPSVLNCKHLSSNRVKGCSYSSWVAAYLQSGHLCQPRRQTKVTILTLHSDPLKGCFHPYTVARLQSLSVTIIHSVTRTSPPRALLIWQAVLRLAHSLYLAFFAIFKPVEHAQSVVLVIVTANGAWGSAAVQGFQTLLANWEEGRRLDALLDHLYRSREDQEGHSVFSRFCAWQNRYCQIRCCLDQRDFFFEI